MEKRIQSTNDSSIVSKCSMISQSYFNDTFLPFMIPKIIRRAPLINRGYYIRMMAVDKVLRHFATSSHPEEESTRVIISLGAGFDTSFFRLFKEGILDNVKFFEIDFYEVALRKSEVIASSPAMWECLPNGKIDTKSNILLSSDSYYLLACDLNHVSVVDACFRSLLDNYNMPTLVMSECVLTYMTAKNSDSIISWVLQEFQNSAFFLYEQVKPNDSFGTFMCNHFQKLGSPLRCINRYSSLKEQTDRFISFGYQYITAIDLNQVYLSFSHTEHERIEGLEIFDEYEEWYEKCGHYFILLAETKDFVEFHKAPLFRQLFGNSSSATSDFDEEVTFIDRPSNHSNVALEHAKCSYEFRLHVAQLAKVRLGDKVWAARIGGYGKDPLQNGHRRLCSITLFDPFSDECAHILPSNSQLLSGCQNSAVCSISDTCVLLFGGKISPLKPNNTFVSVSFSVGVESPNDIRADVSPLQSTGDIPSPRWRHCAAVAVCEGSQYLLVCGGCDSNRKPLSDSFLCRLSPQHDDSYSWKSVDFSPGYKVSAALCSSDDSFYLFGGMDEHFIPCSDLWEFHLLTLSWSRVTLEESLFPRFSHHIVAIGNSLYIFGGVSNASTNSPLGLSVLDLKMLTFSHFDFDLSSLQESLWMSFNMASEVFESEDGGKVVVCVGGGGNCFSFGTHFNGRSIIFRLSNT